jgi:putative ABC transport system substrate-binding protein
MRRRRVLALAGGGMLAAGAARAQPPPGRTFRIGLLNTTTAETNAVIFETLREALAARGYVDGRNIAIEPSYAEGALDRVPALVQALVAGRPDVIVSSTTAATQALAAATADIPIVMMLGNDPIAAGLTASLARPSRNVTGFSNLAEVLAPKRLDYLLQIVPRLRRLGVVYGDTSGVFLRDATVPLAQARGIALVTIEVRDTAGVVSAVAAAMAPPIDALLVNSDPVVYPATLDIAEFAIARHLPAMYTLRQMAVDGGMMAVSYDPFENVHGTADYVARILGGAAVASLPFQQPRRVIFTLNLGAARRAAIEVPAALVALADEVIE